MYTVRTSSGLMVAKITELALDHIVRYSEGLRSVKILDGKRVMCFTILEDGVYQTLNANIYLWENSYIELYQI